MGTATGFRSPPAPPRPPCDAPATVMDRAMAEQAAHAGRMLELAYSNDDCEMAMIWQTAMYSIVRLRHVRRFGSDTQHVKGGAA